MNVPSPDLNLSPSEAIALQKQLAAQVKIAPLDLSTLRTVAGIDVSHKDIGRAAVVVLSYPDLEVVEKVTVEQEVTFPYIPGLLSFRETPVILAALEKLKTTPDALMLDGQGWAHPRRFGIACHVGVLCDLPSVGVAKTRFVGTFDTLGDIPGDTAPLMDKNEQIGVVLRGKKNMNPLYISLGHKMDTASAADLVKSCLRGYKLPEPTRRAHNTAGNLLDN